MSARPAVRFHSRIGLGEPNSTFRSPERTFAPAVSSANNAMTTDRTGHVSSRDLDEENDEDEVAIMIPSVNERLGHLRPSRELLEYYRKKIAEFDGEHEDMLNRLEQYKMTYEQQHKLEWELRQREEEIAELQKALSDMQVYLFQERDHVLRLFAENDRLKIQELQDRKRIQHLLSLSSPAGPEVTYFHKEPPSRAIVTQKEPQKRYPHTENRLGLKAEVPQKSKSNGMRKEAQQRVASKTSKAKQHPSHPKPTTPNTNSLPTADTETLLLHIEALQSQMKEQAQLSRDQTEALLEDRRVRMEELQTVIERDRSKIQSLNDKLHRTQQMLYDSTKDYLELKYEGRSQERVWMAEKDRLLQDLDRCKEQLDVSKDDVLIIPDRTVEDRETQNLEIESLENQLEQAQKLADMYREQVIGLEDELARIRERDDVSKDAYKDKMEKLAKRLHLMNQRYEALEKRRNLEIEGFKNDTRILRTRLKDVEKQLYKVTVGVGEDGDMYMLHDVHQTAKRSRKMQSELQRLKAQIYGMENDLRNL